MKPPKKSGKGSTRQVVKLRCPNCGLFLVARSRRETLATMQGAHACPESLGFTRGKMPQSPR